MLAWPKNRYKCWISLVRGCIYLMGERGTPLGTRARCTGAYVTAFTGRYARHMFAEAVLFVSAPLGFLLWPLTEPARKVRRTWMRRRTESQPAVTR